MIFILEGPSDDTSLTGSLNHIFASSRIEPLIMHRDITSDRNVTHRNIIRKLHEEIQAFCSKNFLPKATSFVLCILLIPMEPLFPMS